MPSWVVHGYEEYAKRLPDSFALQLHEIEAVKRTKSISSQRAKTLESTKLLGAIPRGSGCIALDEHGRARSTREWSMQIERWLQSGRDMSILIGGADGLDQSCLDRADSVWSLSPLTFPHALVRVVVAEQLYRAFSLLNNHPYHRE